jgi:hypothetical protein
VPSARHATHVLDGRRIATLAEFRAEVGGALLDDPAWDADVLGDALGALLRDAAGGAPLRLEWRHAAASRERLGPDATVRELTRHLRDCPPNVLIRTAWALRAALRGEGPTLFDRLVAAMRAQPRVTLVLDDEDAARAAP